MDCRSPGSSVHGISYSRILEWAAISFSLPDPGLIPACFAGRFFAPEPPGKPYYKDRYTYDRGLPQWLTGKESAYNARDTGDISSIDGWGRSPRKWQPTPAFLPEKFHGQRSLAGSSPWGHKESDMTEHVHIFIIRIELNSFIYVWYNEYMSSIIFLGKSLLEL